MFVFFKQKTAYEMRISDWSSDVCSSDLFDERVAIDDLPFGGRHLLAHGELLRAHGGLDARQALHVLNEVAETVHDAPPAGFDDLALQDRIGGKEVGWRESSEEHTSELKSLMRISYAVV